MIENFDEILLTTLGITPSNFERDYFQWTYQFKKKSLTLDFIYSIDGTISTSLYYKKELLSFCYSYGLTKLSLYDGKIIGTIVQKNNVRKVEIDTLSISVKWTDELLL